jgi:hypothetical protein
VTFFAGFGRDGTSNEIIPSQKTALIKELADG